MKLFDWLRPRRGPAEPATPPAPIEDARLEARIARAHEGVPLGDDDWALFDKLIARGHEQPAIELLRRFVAAQPTDLDAVMRLCELLCGRLEHAAARPLLERLVASPPHRERALLLLGDEAERAGDLERAEGMYERVLARNIDHARARSSADRLRAGRRPAPRPEAAPPTLDGPGGVTTPLQGRYRLLAELGRGASGTVYRALDTQLEREVALKILHPHARGAGDPAQARLRAWQEARVAATLRHPGVATVYDLDEERQLLAMELCRGGSLRDRLLEGPLAPPDALHALAQLGEVLAAAHARGIVHGDVKPANLLLRHPRAAALGDDELVLCDFGVARLSDDAAPAIEQRAARGTLAYMAPEQRRGELSPAADVYAAGVILLELLGGHEALAPWLGDRAALLRGDLIQPPGLLPGLGASLGPIARPVEDLLASLLAPDATQRPSGDELARRARALARGM